MRRQRVGERIDDTYSMQTISWTVTRFALVPLLVLSFSVFLTATPRSACFAQGTLPSYILPDQNLPADYDGGQSVEAADFNNDGRPDLLLISNGGGIDAIWNRSSEDDFKFTRLLNVQGEPAIPWTPGNDGMAYDTCFLDLLDVDAQGQEIYSLDTDGVPDHFYVAVAAHEPHTKYQDRLFYIDRSGDTIGFEDRTYRVVPPTAPDDFRLPLEYDVGGQAGSPHNSHDVIFTRNLVEADEDTKNLYLILAGGLYGYKSALTDISNMYPGKSPLRVLKYNPQGSDFGFEDVTDDVFNEGENKYSVMTDLDMIDADGDDSVDDLLVSVHYEEGLETYLLPPHPPLPPFKKPQIFIYDSTDGDNGKFHNLTQYYLGDAPAEVSTLGAVSGDFYTDEGGTDDLLLLHDPPAVYKHSLNDPGCPEDPVFHEQNCFTKQASAIDWNRDDLSDLSLCFNRLSFQGTFVRDKYVVVAAQFPYILEIVTPVPPATHVLSEIDLIQDMGMSSPFAQIYTSTDLLVVNLDEDPNNVEEIVFADQTEQNRLWKCEVDGSGNWYPTHDVTHKYFPADGVDSQRILVADLDNDESPDVVAINEKKPPDVYLFDTDFQTYSSLEPSYDYFEFGTGDLVCGAAPFFGVGGVDGVFFELAPGRLGLAVAGNDHYNQLYEWNYGIQKFVFDSDHSLAAVNLVGNPLRRWSKGVSAGDLNDDTWIDVVFANQSVPPIGLEVFYNQGGSFSPQWSPNDLYRQEIAQGSYQTVLVTDPTTTGGEIHGQKYILAGHGNFGQEGEIDVFAYPKNQYGNYEHICSVEVGQNALPVRIIPMNLDNPEETAFKDDYFIPTKTVVGRQDLTRNAVLRYTPEETCPFVALQLNFDAACDPLKFQEDNINGGDTYDIDGDGLDDFLAAHHQDKDVIDSTSGTYIYVNNWDPEDPTTCVPVEDRSEDVFAEGYPLYDTGDSQDAGFVDVFSGGDGKPEIVLARDGQNRLLLPDTDRDGIHDECDSEPTDETMGDEDQDGSGSLCDCRDDTASVYPSAPENCPGEPWVSNPDYFDNSCSQDGGYCKINEGCDGFYLLWPAHGAELDSPTDLRASAGSYNYFRAYLQYTSNDDTSVERILWSEEPYYSGCTYAAGTPPPEHSIYYAIYYYWNEIKEDTYAYWTVFGVNDPYANPVVYETACGEYEDFPEVCERQYNAFKKDAIPGP